MPWKKTDDGKLAIDQNGNPIRIDSDGKEYAMPDDAIDATISNLMKANGESAERKRKLREAETRLAHFEAIEDPEKFLSEANKALATLRNLDDKKLIDAGEVENLKRSISESYEKKLADLGTSIKDKDGLIYKLMVSEKFATSEAIGKTILPPDVAEAYFGKHFKIEDGQVIGYLNDDKIYSKEKPGAIASFDEALSEVIDKYPMKDRILKPAPGGSGTAPNTGGGNNYGGDWHKMSPTERLNHARNIKQ